MIKEIINKYSKQRKEKRDFAYFLSHSTNVKLQDRLNNTMRPDTKLLRILGNGGSLKSVLDTMSNDCDYMVMNAHILHSSYMELKPKYYVLADPAFFYPRANYDGTKIVRKILEETTWAMTLFVPWEHTRGVELESTKWVTVEYVNQSLYNGPEQYREFVYEHNLAMPNVNNVLASAIYLSIYLGYSNVELYGVEHSWTRDIYVNDQNQTCMRDSHFYDKEVVTENVIIDANGYPMKFHEVLKLYMDYFPAYWELRGLAEKHNCHIVNCSPNSFIDAFEKRRI